MNISTQLKKGDTVGIRQGKDKGKSGKILAVDRLKNKVSVEGLNIAHRFEKAQQGGKAGTKISFPAYMPASRVVLICPNCNKASRIGNQFLENGKKQRMCKKCGKAI